MEHEILNWTMYLSSLQIQNLQKKEIQNLQKKEIQKASTRNTDMVMKMIHLASRTLVVYHVCFLPSVAALNQNSQYYCNV